MIGNKSFHKHLLWEPRMPFPLISLSLSLPVSLVSRDATVLPVWRALIRFQSQTLHKSLSSVCVCVCVCVRGLSQLISLRETACVEVPIKHRVSVWILFLTMEMKHVYLAGESVRNRVWRDVYVCVSIFIHVCLWKR